MSKRKPRLVLVPRIEAPDYNDDGLEVTKVITVRLPDSLHRALRAQSYEQKTSLNRLAVAKLLGESVTLETDLAPHSATKGQGAESPSPCYVARPDENAWREMFARLADNVVGRRRKGRG